MPKFGLKVWSSNKNYFESAQKLYQKNIYDYIELYVDPVSENQTAQDWNSLKIPFHLHGPHSYSGLNFSLKEKEFENRELIQKVEHFRKVLNPVYIIFHPGLNGVLKETIRQLSQFQSQFPEIFKRTLIENKPKLGLKDEICLGSSPEEIRRIMDEIGLVFCVDIGYAIYFAAWAQLPWEKVIEKFNTFNPAVYHLSDGDTASVKDMHEQFGCGNFDLARIIKMIPKDAFVAIETKRDVQQQLSDFEKDVNFLKRYVG